MTFKLTDGEETATGTYTPTVDAPAAPAPGALTSTGTGTAPQSATIEFGDGETVSLLDSGSNAVNEVVVPGVGTYVINPETGVITFVADAGYSGTPEGVTYQVTDIYAQTGEATYTPTVGKPAAPAAPPKTTQGGSGATQSTTVTVPAGGGAALLDGEDLVTQVVVPGEGTYTIDPETGVITFVPLAGYSGTGAGVTYVVTDAYGQASEGTYRPTVTAKVAPGPAPKLKVNAPALVKVNRAGGRFGTTCAVRHGKATVCTVALTAKVNGDTTAIGWGTAKPAHGVKRAHVAIHLTRLGKALAMRPGGVPAIARAQAKVGPKKWLRAADRTRVVTKVTPVARAVHFDASSASLRTGDKAFLAQLRHKLAGVKQIVCAGYTDSSGNGQANKALGLERAKNTCSYLAGKLKIKTSVVSYGEARPTAPNSNESGRALNRRAEVTLKY